MPIPIPSEIIDDDRLAQAFLEVFGKSVTFDMEKEIKRASRALYGEPNTGCPFCSADTDGPCTSCKRYAKEGKE